MLARAKTLRAFSCFISRYVPAIFLIGRMCRDINWSHRVAGGGVVAGQIMAYAVVLINGLKLPTGRQYDEYLNALGPALLTHTAAHLDLSGSAYGEEFCEAMLSRLSCRIIEHHISGMVNDRDDVFVSMPKVSDAHKDLARPLPVGFAFKISEMINPLMHQLMLGTFRGHEYGESKTNIVRTVDPSSTTAWPSYSLHMRKDRCVDILTHTLQTLTSSMTSSVDILAEMANFVPLADPAQRTRHVQLQRLLNPPPKPRAPKAKPKAAKARAPSARPQARVPADVISDTDDDVVDEAM
jgi:hypothetical protein